MCRTLVVLFNTDGALEPSKIRVIQSKQTEPLTQYDSFVIDHSLSSDGSLKSNHVQNTASKIGQEYLFDPVLQDKVIGHVEADLAETEVSRVLNVVQNFISRLW